VLTDRDVLRNAADAELMTAGEVASEPVLVACPSDAPADVAKAMARLDTSHVLVVDPRTSRPVGIVSTLDIAGSSGGAGPEGTREDACRDSVVLLTPDRDRPRCRRALHPVSFTACRPSRRLRVTRQVLPPISNGGASNSARRACVPSCGSCACAPATTWTVTARSPDHFDTPLVASS
jgi:hypothetical protein